MAWCTPGDPCSPVLCDGGALYRVGGGVAPERLPQLLYEAELEVHHHVQDGLQGRRRRSRERRKETGEEVKERGGEWGRRVKDREEVCVTHTHSSCRSWSFR